MIFRDGWGLSLPNICLTVKENPGKLTRPGIEPRPLGERQQSYSSSTAIVTKHIVRSIISAIPFFLLILYHHHHQSVLLKSRSFTASAGTKAAVLSKTGLPPQTQEPRLQFYQEWIGAVHSHCFLHPTLTLASEQTLKPEKTSGAPMWGEWIWLTGSSGLHQNSPQGFNISSIRVFDQIRDSEIPVILYLPINTNDRFFL